METVKKVELKRFAIYPALMGLGIVLFVSCAEEPPPPPLQSVAIKPPSPPPQPAPRKERTFPLPGHKPSPPPENPANVPQSEDEAVALASPESQPPAYDRSRLVGLDQPAARRLLGTATEQSEAPPATIWRYRTATCELDLFFYLDLRSGKMRTLHYAFKGDQGGGEDCLRSVVAARSS